MLDYDLEAERYDRTRGGTARAAAAADALIGLLPPGPVLDVAGGTGIVGAQLRRRGIQVVVADRSAGMLQKAADRLPGRVLRADGSRLPIADRSVGAVIMIWLLHLVPDARPFIAEAARVLRPGGVFLSTVDKSAAIGRTRAAATDADTLVASIAGAHGLSEVGRRHFRGHGQTRSDAGEPLYSVVGYARPS